jgi:hypothetical protein
MLSTLNEVGRFADYEALAFARVPDHSCIRIESTLIATAYLYS